MRPNVFLYTKHPELAEEYADENILSFNQIDLKCEEIVKWICSKCKNSYWNSPVRQAANKQKCPYCSNREILPGYNDLYTLKPDLIKEWDFQKNKISPKTIYPYSKENYWWICKEGHSWKERLANRSAYSKNKCKECNSFKFKYPELAEDYSNKNSIPVNLIAARSNKKVFWNCKNCGGEYERTPDIKTKSPACPYCTGQQVLSGFNDLASKYPELIEYWNFSKNNIEPKEVSCASGESFNWVCKNNHEFSLRIGELFNKKINADSAQGEKIMSIQKIIYF